MELEKDQVGGNNRWWKQDCRLCEKNIENLNHVMNIEQMEQAANIS